MQRQDLGPGVTEQPDGTLRFNPAFGPPAFKGQLNGVHEHKMKTVTLKESPEAGAMQIAEHDFDPEKHEEVKPAARRAVPPPAKE